MRLHCVFAPQNSFEIKRLACISKHKRVGTYTNPFYLFDKCLMLIVLQTYKMHHFLKIESICLVLNEKYLQH
jgi:hypothetical protein